MLRFASCGFNVSVVEIVVALSTGARLCLLPTELQGSDILNYPDTDEITHAILPSPIFQPNQDLYELTRLTVLISTGQSSAASFI